MENDKIWMIDWEFAAISYGHELAYSKIHSYPTPDQFEFSVKKYASHSGLKEQILYNEIVLEEKVTRVNDVIWAAMKWGENKKDKNESIKYKELTCKRIKLYDDFV